MDGEYIHIYIRSRVQTLIPTRKDTHARRQETEETKESQKTRDDVARPSTYLLPELGEQVYTLLLEQPVHGLHGLNVQRVGLRRGLHAGQCRRVQAG